MQRHRLSTPRFTVARPGGNYWRTSVATVNGRSGKQSIAHLLSMPQRARQSYLMSLPVDLRVELQYRLSRVLDGGLTAELEAHRCRASEEE